MHTVVGRFSRLSGKNQRIVAQIQVGVPGLRSGALLRMRTSFVENCRSRLFPQKRNPVYLDSGSPSDPISFLASEVKQVLRTVLKSLRFLRENREEAVRVAMGWLSIDRDLAERSYDVMLPNYSYDGTISTEGLKASIDLLAKRSTGPRKTFSPADMTDFSLLEEARREMSR